VLDLQLLQFFPFNPPYDLRAGEAASRHSLAHSLPRSLGRIKLIFTFCQKAIIKHAGDDRLRGSNYSLLP